MYRLYVLEDIPGKVRGIGRREVKHQDFETLEEAKKELARMRDNLIGKKFQPSRSTDWQVAHNYRAHVKGKYLEIKEVF